MQYEMFGNDDQAAYLADRQRALEAEHYANSTALAVEESKPDTERDPKLVAHLKSNLETIEAAHTEVKARREALATS